MSTDSLSISEHMVVLTARSHGQVIEVACPAGRSVMSISDARRLYENLQAAIQVAEKHTIPPNTE